jgi:hypothetical protein
MVRRLLKLRPMRVRLAWPVLLLLLAPACVFYADDDDDPCQYGGGDVDPGGGADYYDPGLRNPDTGECVYEGGGGGGGGGGGCDACGNCPPRGEETDSAGADAAQEPLPTWGTCEGQCTGLDEETCMATSACRAIYVGGGDALTYADCWAVDTTGPIQGGGCDGLDATTCSMHDDCSAVHEPACPDGDAAGIEAPEPVDCTTPGAFGFCIAEGETGGPGECEGEVTCDGLLPDCPEGTTPGIADGCYTGYCIPLEDCDGAPACAELADESSCVDRADCVPIYEGVDCECADIDCTCADWVFTSCE